jgi:hypothetical protein
MENGDHGQYMSKTKDQSKFIVGVEANYTHDTSKPDFPKIKPFNEFKPNVSGNNFNGSRQSQNSPDVQKMIVRQSSLKAAVDICSPKNMQVKDVLEVADIFVAWVYEEKPKAEMQEVGTNDMPF